MKEINDIEIRKAIQRVNKAGYVVIYFAFGVTPWVLRGYSWFCAQESTPGGVQGTIWDAGD